MNKLYHGLANGTVLVCEQDGAAPSRPLDPRLDLRRHSPTGFAWGYGGSGPAQLALALACDVLGDDAHALRSYQELKARFVVDLPQGRAWGPVSAEDLKHELAAISASLTAAG